MIRSVASRFCYMLNDSTFGGIGRLISVIGGTPGDIKSVIVVFLSYSILTLRRL